jgi:hypothetical protein
VPNVGADIWPAPCAVKRAIDLGSLVESYRFGVTMPG